MKKTHKKQKTNQIAIMQSIRKKGMRATQVFESHKIYKRRKKHKNCQEE